MPNDGEGEWGGRSDEGRKGLKLTVNSDNFTAVLGYS